MNNTNTLPSALRLNLHYLAMQMCYWMMYSAACSYQTALLIARGFTSGQIGILIAVRALSGVILLPLIGSFSDRHPKIPVRLLFILSLSLAMLSGFALMLPMGMAGTVAVLFVMGAFGMSAYPLMDTMALEFMAVGVPIRYSIGRGGGSLAYAVMCIFLGMQVGRWGVESTLITHVVMIGLVMLVAGLYPLPPARAVRQDLPPPQGALSLLRGNPAFTVMLLSVFFGLTALLPTTNFLVNMTNASGGTPEHLGFAMFLMAASEVPTAILFAKMHKRWGSGQLLLASMCFIALKIFLLMVTSSLSAILLLQLLQSVGYGLFTPASVYFVNESVPEADRVLGQTLLLVASNGMGGVMGGLVGGYSLDWGGIPGMLTTALILAAVGVALAILSLRIRRNSKVVTAP